MRVYDSMGREYPYSTQAEFLTVSAESIGLNVDYIEFDFGDLSAEVGDEGWYLIGDTFHTGTQLCRFTQKEDCEYIIHQKLMPLFAVKTKNVCRLVICEGMRYSFFVRTGVKDGNFFIYPRIVLDGDAPYEDIVLRTVDFDKSCDYSDMAGYYRNLRLASDCVPIKEREKKNKHLAYAADAPEIRIRMGWKPVPSPIGYQTPETEPPVKVACTFKRASEFVDKLYSEGVDKAQICLVGWNKGGHDGRYPDLFPVEETLGGEEELKKLIANAQSKGYKIVCHTNSTDCYSIAKDFKLDWVIKKKDGSLSMEGMRWGGGEMFHLCSEVAYKQAKENLPKVRELGFEGLHYIDVMSSRLPVKCYDAAHPMTLADAADRYEKMGKLSAELFGGFASEGAFDYAAPYLDYGLYVTFSENAKPFFDIEIPFWELVYHGIVLANASTHTVNYPIKRDIDTLKYIEYGCRPSFYLYSKFIVNDALTDWLGKDDLTIDNDAELEQSVAMIKRSYDEYKSIRHLQREFMMKHEIDGDIHTVTYSDGTRAVLDYSSNTYSFENAN